MTIVTVALGEKHQQAAESLRQHFPELIVISEAKLEHQRPKLKHTAHRVKSAFIDYLPQTTGPILFLDADMQVMVDSPLAELPTIDAPIAGVTWCKGPLPPIKKFYPYNNQNAIGLNSGFLLFRDRAAATPICLVWHRLLSNSHYHLDELHLHGALVSLNITPTLLPEKYNSRIESGAVFWHQRFSRNLTK